MQCEICPSAVNVTATDVGLACCEECRRIFGFIEVDEPKEPPAPVNAGDVEVPLEK